MDFLLYIRCGEVPPPPPPYTIQTIVLLLFTSSIFKDTLYFYLSTFCFQYFLLLLKSFYC